jgi:cyclopropane-fatty-acyl-phospholipid synthase
LPTFEHLQKHGSLAKLTWLHSDSFGSHYARTLEEWRERFLASWSEIAKLGFDERFRRMWEQYLRYCEAGFAAGTIDVHQIAFGKPSET